MEGHHATLDPTIQRSDKHHPSGENALFQTQTDKQTNKRILSRHILSSTSLSNIMEEDGCGVMRSFLDPTAVMFMVGHCISLPH